MIAFALQLRISALAGIVTHRPGHGHNQQAQLSHDDASL